MLTNKSIQRNYGTGQWPNVKTASPAKIQKSLSDNDFVVLGCNSAPGCAGEWQFLTNKGILCPYEIDVTILGCGPHIKISMKEAEMLSLIPSIYPTPTEWIRL